MSDEIKKGLLGIVVDETEVSKVMPEINSLTYRGYAAQDLCEYCRFEEVAYLILNKDLPNTIELRKFEKEEKNNRELSKDLYSILKKMPKKSHPMDVARTAVSIMGLEDKETTDSSPEANMRKAIRILAKTPTALAAFYRLRKGKNIIKPKKNLKKDFFKDDFLINRILLIIEKFLKTHIKNQIENGANIIQIFDSWAGLLEEKDLPNYVYSPTLNLVNYVKSLNVPVICFPREIKNYKEFCNIVEPDAISIDYNVDPKRILRDIKIPVQGGLDPKILLTNKETLKKEATKYLEIFKNHPYIFNLGHGILPETNPEMVENLIKIVKNFK